jgi:hypothetical protein
MRTATTLLTTRGKTIVLPLRIQCGAVRWGHARARAWTFGIDHGRVDILAMLTWLEDHKYLKANSSLEQIDYGFELSSTNGLDETFAVSGLPIKSR